MTLHILCAGYPSTGMLISVFVRVLIRVLATGEPTSRSVRGVGVPLTSAWYVLDVCMCVGGRVCVCVFVCSCGC